MVRPARRPRVWKHPWANCWPRTAPSSQPRARVCQFIGELVGAPGVSAGVGAPSVSVGARPLFWA
eukprot:736207-Lingulodinium_polyedra.AAC.1